MTTSRMYPKEPFIGVDCSGQPRDSQMIAVATRYSRRNKQRCWIVQVSQEQILRISGKYPEWELKLYAALFFRVINEVIAEGYEIHIDKELPQNGHKPK